MSTLSPTASNNVFMPPSVTEKLRTALPLSQRSADVSELRAMIADDVTPNVTRSTQRLIDDDLALIARGGFAAPRAAEHLLANLWRLANKGKIDPEVVIAIEQQLGKILGVSKMSCSGFEQPTALPTPPAVASTQPEENGGLGGGLGTLLTGFAGAVTEGAVSLGKSALGAITSLFG